MSPDRGRPLRGSLSRHPPTNAFVPVGQHQLYHFGLGAPPILVYFSGDWDVHWGYGLLTHSHMSYQNGTLANGTKDQNLRNPSCLISSHSHMSDSTRSPGLQPELQQRAAGVAPWRLQRSAAQGLGHADRGGLPRQDAAGAGGAAAGGAHRHLRGRRIWWVVQSVGLHLWGEAVVFRGFSGGALFPVPRVVFRCFCFRVAFSCLGFQLVETNLGHVVVLLAC